MKTPNSKSTGKFVALISTLGLAFIATLYLCDRSGHPSGAAPNAQQIMDTMTVNRIVALGRQNPNANFVFIGKYQGLDIMRNRIIILPPVGDDLRIDFDKYVHKGHFGPLFIILPDNYAGPKEKFILKSFPGYKGWYGSMLSEKFVMYAAK